MPTFNPYLCMSSYAVLLIFRDSHTVVVIPLVVRIVSSGGMQECENQDTRYFHQIFAALQCAANQDEKIPSKIWKLTGKYDPDYVNIGFTATDVNNEPRPQCVICFEIFQTKV